MTEINWKKTLTKRDCNWTVLIMRHYLLFNYLSGTNLFQCWESRLLCIRRWPGHAWRLPAKQLRRHWQLTSLERVTPSRVHRQTTDEQHEPGAQRPTPATHGGHKNTVTQPEAVRHNSLTYALEVSPFHGIALYESILLTSIFYTLACHLVISWSVIEIKLFG